MWALFLELGSVPQPKGGWCPGLQETQHQGLGTSVSLLGLRSHLASQALWCQGVSGPVIPRTPPRSYLNTEHQSCSDHQD
jgi:hypothetical protein